MTEWIALVAGIGSAAAAGFYLAFSAVVMPALRRRPAPDASETMAAINEDAERAPFMIVFFGTAIASVAAIIVAVTDPQAAPLARIAGAALYLAGFVLTVVANVPLNRRLAAATGGRAAYWPRYERPWTRLNHLRAVLSVAGAVALLAPIA